MALFAELKQRKVFRVAAAYAVVAWLLIQVASAVLPALKLPDWTVTFTTILLLLGFPVALLLAWSFEVVRDRGTTVAPGASQSPSIAVLRFANMSDDAALTHFADGLVEDVLTRLQALRWLKVISRQSAYADKTRGADARTIARELGCRYVIEGSVRSHGDRARVTAQLIDAANDEHLWAERYDRPITDSFQLQDEICAEIVGAVESKLTPAASRVDGSAASDNETAAVAATTPRTGPSLGTRRRGAWWAIPLVAVTVLMAAGLTWTLHQRGRERWAREQALPQLQALIAKDDYAGAFDLAARIRSVIPQDPQLRALERAYSAKVELQTSPSGATVSFRPYEAGDSDWRPIGQTPIRGIPAPMGVGVWRFESPGRATALRVFRNTSAELRNDRELAVAAQFKNVDLTLPLADAATAPGDMVLVPATSFEVPLITNGAPIELPAYFLDRYEVTNRQYREFIDAGGYREGAYWQDLPLGSEVATWQDAVARFVDATGRPGPSTWESGNYPDGAADYPVAGVSWYEAVAYARYRGKQLPTAYHWYRAAYSLDEVLDSIASAVVPHSNYSGKAAAPVGQYRGIGPYGTYDMAGNVREWLSTAMGASRMVAGGAWNEPPYIYNQLDSASPWDRSPGNGVRCMRTLSGGPVGVALQGPIVQQLVDFAALKPIDDAAYAVLEQQMQHSQSGLDPRVATLPSANALWTRQAISLATGYDDTRFKVQLFLPSGGRAPYQVVIYLPHVGHYLAGQPSDEFDPTASSQPLDFVLKSGRALVVVTFDGSFERRWSTARRASMTDADRFRLLLRHSGQELGRAIDYLATRKDLDHERIGVIGESWGSQALAALLGVEKRIRAAVLMAGGVFILPMPRTEQPFNYLPHATQPVLMLNGRWDIDVDLDAQDAMLRMLGTPADRKQRILYDAGHGALPHNQVVRASLDWYDRYLGPA